MALDYPEEHRREALLLTAAIVVLLALLCFFIRFTGPNPPLDALGGDGVELNYGLDEAGSGDVQTMAQANASDNREDSRPPAATQPEPTPTAPQPEPSEPTPAEQAKVITSDAEDAGATAPPVEKPVAKPTEPARETPPARPRETPRAVYTPRGSADGAPGGNGVAGRSAAPTGNSNGDHPGSVGDQGDPRGSLNAKALYGEPGSGGSGSRPGSGGGSGLEMSGWAVDDIPSIPKLDDNPGVARFRIVINEDGEVESVTKVSGSISPEQAKAVRDALLNATFRNTNGQGGGATGYFNFRYSAR